MTGKRFGQREGSPALKKGNGGVEGEVLKGWQQRTRWGTARGKPGSNSLSEIIRGGKTLEGLRVYLPGNVTHFQTSLAGEDPYAKKKGISMGERNEFRGKNS